MSPDINPIEKLWAIIERRLDKYENPPTILIISYYRTFHKTSVRRLQLLLVTVGLWRPDSNSKNARGFHSNSRLGKVNGFDVSACDRKQ